MEPASKRCSKCGVVKPLAEFGKNKSRKDGCQDYCNECRHQYRASNGNHEAARVQRWRDNNKELAAEYARGYQAANKQHLAEYIRRWRADNNEHINEKKRQYRTNHPDIQRIAGHRRRARKRELPHDWTKADMVHALRVFDNKCAACGTGLLLEAVHWDHVIPISDKRPDNPGTVPGNMAPMCSKCNQSKHTTDYRAWFKRNGYNLQALESALELCKRTATGKYEDAVITRMP